MSSRVSSDVSRDRWKSWFGTDGAHMARISRQFLGKFAFERKPESPHLIYVCRQAIFWRTINAIVPISQHDHPPRYDIALDDEIHDLLGYDLARMTGDLQGIETIVGDVFEENFDFKMTVNKSFPLWPEMFCQNLMACLKLKMFYTLQGRPELGDPLLLLWRLGNLPIGFKGNRLLLLCSKLLPKVEKS